ncbi:MAG: YibE/F family protein [Christensenellaceae bacterium]|jgi:uncharacterized membrane protein|nr:YibE/F family protein [Christensenellaceae bacterium]
MVFARRGFPFGVRAARKELLLCAVLCAAVLALLFLPTGFQTSPYLNAQGVRATVLSVDDSGVYANGLIKQGDQRCVVRIEEGSHRGETVTGMNIFTGKLEFDKVFSVGDEAWVLLEQNAEGAITFANLVEHYRFDKELWLIALFAALLIVFSGVTGLRTLLSFAFALLTIWKLLIPLLLKGVHPMLVALLTGNLISVATLLLVAGLTKKAYAAIFGTAICSLLSSMLAMAFGRVFAVHGAVMQWSESLVYAGFERLDLTMIFQAGIYLASSGAILDLAMDISAALDELAQNLPQASFKALWVSGWRIGRSIVGSQTTTLLLAYMGGYLSVLMVYMAQGTQLMSVLNSKSIAAEILHSFVGCIGLVLVCPLTSLIAAAMMCGRERAAGESEASAFGWRKGKKGE